MTTLETRTYLMTEDMKSPLLKVLMSASRILYMLSYVDVCYMLTVERQLGYQSTCLIVLIVFVARLHNKGVYFKIGLRKMMFRRPSKDLHRVIRLEVDSKLIDLPPVEGIIILNILRS